MYPKSVEFEAAISLRAQHSPNSPPAPHPLDFCHRRPLTGPAEGLKSSFRLESCLRLHHHPPPAPAPAPDHPTVDCAPRTRTFSFAYHHTPERQRPQCLRLRAGTSQIEPPSSHETEHGAWNTAVALTRLPAAKRGSQYCDPTRWRQRERIKRSTRWTSTLEMCGIGMSMCKYSCLGYALVSS